MSDVQWLINSQLGMSPEEDEEEDPLPTLPKEPTLPEEPTLPKEPTLPEEPTIPKEPTLPKEISHVEIPPVRLHSPLPAPTIATASEVSSIVNELVFSAEQQPNKRKASNMSDDEAPQPRAGKKQKVDTIKTNATVRSPRGNSQQPTGKLKRPSKPVPQINTRSREARDIFLPEDSQDDAVEEPQGDAVEDDVIEDLQDVAIEGSKEDARAVHANVVLPANLHENPAALQYASPRALRSIPELNSKTKRHYKPTDDSTASKSLPEAEKKSRGKKRGPYKKRDAAEALPQQTKTSNDSPRHNTRSRQAETKTKSDPKNPKQDVAPAQAAPPVRRKPRPGKKTKVQPNAMSVQSEDHKGIDNHVDASQNDAEHGILLSRSASPNDSDDDSEVNKPAPQSATSGAQIDTIVKPVSWSTRQNVERSEVAETPTNLSDVASQEPSSDAARNNESPGRYAQDLTVLSEEPRPELFGLDEDWRKIQTARGKIGVSNIEGRKSTGKPKLSTAHVIDLVRSIKKLTRLYSSIPDGLSGSTVANDLTEHLEELLESIRVSIDGLSESEFQDNANAVVQDVYAYAIPKMVVLLDKALIARSAQLLKKSKVDALEEIIRIQDLLLVLCQKARDWNAKPTTDRPIMRPTMSIRPPLKALRKRFRATLAGRKRRLERNITDAKARQLEEECAQEAWEEAQRKMKAHQARNQLIHEALARKEAELRPAPFLSQLQPQSQVSARRTEKSQWSYEQDRVLLKEIFAEKHGDIPGKIVAYHCFWR